VAVVLDSSVVVGFLDRSDDLHGVADEAIRDLLGSHRLFVSVITYAEVLTGARLGHHNEEHVVGFFADLVSSIIPLMCR
jgi:predicted nucleic acid-binding protein